MNTQKTCTHMYSHMYTHVLIIHISMHVHSLMHIWTLSWEAGEYPALKAPSALLGPPQSSLALGALGAANQGPRLGGWQPDPQKETPTPSCRGTNKGRLQLRQTQWPLDHLSLRPSEAASREGLGIHRAAASPPCLAMNQASRPCLLPGCTCPPRVSV